MKNSISMILLLVLVVFAGCKKDEETQDEFPGNSFTAKVSGAQFTANSFALNIAAGSKIINAIQGNNSFVLAVPSDIAVGTYTSLPAPNYIQYYEGSTPYNAIVMNVSISENDLTNKILGGTFSFTGTNYVDTISITGGSFRVKF